jgi:hypothetical protein
VRVLPALLAVSSALLAGCASPGVTIVDPYNFDQVGPRIDGECRIVLRTGAVTVADSFRMQRGTAIWRSGALPREQSAPAADLAALQIRDRGSGVARGVALGLLCGVLVGAIAEASNGEQNDDFILDESDRRWISGIAGGVIGAVGGGVVGGGIGVWKDRYRFLQEAAEPGGITPPPGEPSPPGGPVRP